MVERGTRTFMKYIHTINNDEYSSNEFENHYSRPGVRHEKTVFHTLKHSGCDRENESHYYREGQMYVENGPTAKFFFG